MMDSLEEIQLAKKPIQKATVYKIPVVFHVLHNGGVENISDEQIYDCLDLLNRDYRLLNQDANNVHAEFQGMPADIEVEFLLATKAPNGQCFKGITRTLSPMSYDGADGGNQVDAIIAAMMWLTENGQGINILMFLFVEILVVLRGIQQNHPVGLQHK